MTARDVLALLVYLFNEEAREAVVRVLAQLTPVECSKLDARAMYELEREKVERRWARRMDAAERGSVARVVVQPARSTLGGKYKTVRYSAKLRQYKVCTMMQEPTTRRYARRYVVAAVEGTRAHEYKLGADRTAIMVQAGKWKQARNVYAARLLAFVMREKQRTEARELGRSTYATLPAQVNPLAQFRTTFTERLILSGHAGKLSDADACTLYDGARAMDRVCFRHQPRRTQAPVSTKRAPRSRVPKRTVRYVDGVAICR